jgi:hypothetical protein
MKFEEECAKMIVDRDRSEIKSKELKIDCDRFKAKYEGASDQISDFVMKQIKINPKSLDQTVALINEAL